MSSWSHHSSFESQNASWTAVLEYLQFIRVLGLTILWKFSKFLQSTLITSEVNKSVLHIFYFPLCNYLPFLTHLPCMWVYFLTNGCMELTKWQKSVSIQWTKITLTWESALVSLLNFNWINMISNDPYITAQFLFFSVSQDAKGKSVCLFTICHMILV